MLWTEQYATMRKKDKDSIEKRYYKIREVSEITGVPIPTLRFWEKEFPQLKPVRNEGMTRFYTPKNLETVRMVKYLLKDRGLKIDAAREEMRSGSSAVIKRREAVIMLMDMRETLQQMLDALNHKR